MTILLQALRIGGATIAALPNEVYALTGLRLRARSPAPLHFNVELANGAEGYIPPPEQHVLGGYTTWPARTAGLEVEAIGHILGNRRADRASDEVHRVPPTSKPMTKEMLIEVLEDEPLGPSRRGGHHADVRYVAQPHRRARGRLDHHIG